MKNIEAASPQQFRAVVFKRLPSSDDFSRSEAVALPGRHTAAEARDLLEAVLRSSEGRAYIGGEAQPVP